MRLMDQITLYFCRLGVAGLDPKAPGTWGTAMACLLAPYIFLPLHFWMRLVVLVVLFFLGAVAATRAETLLGRKDPGEVVIDELVGVWLVLAIVRTVRCNKRQKAKIAAANAAK